MVSHGVLGRSRTSIYQVPNVSALECAAAVCKNHVECPKLCKRATYV